MTKCIVFEMIYAFFDIHIAKSMLYNEFRR